MRRLLLQALVLPLALSACSADADAPAQAPASTAIPPACSQAPAPEDIEVAKAAHKAATQAYEHGDYDEAIRRWIDAYHADCTAHGLLVNIANAYQKKGDNQTAIAVFEAYLKRTGSSPSPAQAPAPSPSPP